MALGTVGLKRTRAGFGFSGLGSVATDPIYTAARQAVTRARAVANFNDANANLSQLTQALIWADQALPDYVVNGELTDRGRFDLGYFTGLLNKDIEAQGGSTGGGSGGGGTVVTADPVYIAARQALARGRGVANFNDARANLSQLNQALIWVDQELSGYVVNGQLTDRGRFDLGYFTGLLNAELDAYGGGQPAPPQPQLTPSQQRPDLAQWVNSLYQTYFGRNGEQSGIDSWVAAMLNGASVAQVEAGFANSPEYQAILAAHAAAGTPVPTPTPTPTPTPISNPLPPVYIPAPTPTPTASGGTDFLTQIKDQWNSISTPVKIGAAVVIGLMVFGGGGSSKRR